jgi:hypothetical protein
MGKSTIIMGHFQWQTVCLPEGGSTPMYQLLSAFTSDFADGFKGYRAEPTHNLFLKT